MTRMCCVKCLPVTACAAGALEDFEIEVEDEALKADLATACKELAELKTKHAEVLVKHSELDNVPPSLQLLRRHPTFSVESRMPCADAVSYCTHC